MSFIDTDGRSPRFLTRAQKWAITSESAPSSSKKWLSTDTRSTRRTSASTSAKLLSAPVVAALPRSSINVDSAMSDRDDLTSSHGLVKEVGEAQVLAAGDRLVVYPLANREVEYPHAERRENDRTAAIHRSSSGHDVGKSARHEASISCLLFREMGRRVGLHHVLDVVNHVLGFQQY